MYSVPLDVQLDETQLALAVFLSTPMYFVTSGVPVELPPEVTHEQERSFLQEINVSEIRIAENIYSFFISGLFLFLIF